MPWNISSSSLAIRATDSSNSVGISTGVARETSLVTNMLLRERSPAFFKLTSGRLTKYLWGVTLPETTRAAPPGKTSIATA